VKRSITETYLERYRDLVARAGDSEHFFPLTGAQRRFFISRELDPNGRPAIVPLFFCFPLGTIDLVRLRGAATRFAMRHTVLRGAPTVLNGLPVLRAGSASVKVQETGIRPGLTAMETILHELHGWDPNGGALQFLLVRDLDHEDELLALVLDHMVCDERSIGLVTAGISEAYGERTEPGLSRTAAADDAAYRDAVQLQLDTEREASAPPALTYWAERLGVLTNRTSTHSRLHEGKESDFKGNGMLDHRLPATSGKMRGAVFPALLHAISTALRSVLGPEETPALGYPWGGRPATKFDVLGCFINTVVYPASAEPKSIEEIKADWWRDLDYADTPFDEVVNVARAAGARWAGSLDGILTFEDLKQRPHLSLGGTIGRETHSVLSHRDETPFSVAASHGEDLLIRWVWDRDHLADDDAHAAFKTLLHTLRIDLNAAAGFPAYAGDSRRHKFFC
jgi:hypothetical protein